MIQNARSNLKVEKLDVHHAICAPGFNVLQFLRRLLKKIFFYVLIWLSFLSHLLFYNLARVLQPGINLFSVMFLQSSSAYLISISNSCSRQPQV